MVLKSISDHSRQKQKPTPSTFKSGKSSTASLLEIFDVSQGDSAWFQARCGIVTASNFGTVLAEGRDGPSLTRTELIYRIAGEIITGEPAEETFKSRAMERGKEMEPAAVADYEHRTGESVRRVGFAVNFSGLKRCGSSPDGLVGFDGGLETKTMRPDLMIPLLKRGAIMPAAHRAQVQGNMMVWERDWWDLKIFWPRMPDFTVRVYRDESYIKTLMNEIEKFNWEVRRVVDEMKKMGADVRIGL